MHFAVCCPDETERRRICSIVAEQAAANHRYVEITDFSTEETLWQAFQPGRFRGALVGFGDVRGFLCARRLRESDSACRVILLDDTDRYAIRGLRLHLSDLLVRPLEEDRLRAAIDRLLTD